MISGWSIVVLSLLIGFFAATLIIGYITGKKTQEATKAAKTTEAKLHQFYVAGGTLSWLPVMFTFMATYMEAYEFVGMPAVIVSDGFEWWLLEMIGYLTFVGFFYLGAIRIYRVGKKFQYITPTDLIAHRVGGYERGIRILLGIMITYATILYIGSIYIPAAGVLSAATGGEVGYKTFLLLYVLFIIIYVSAGGMRAVAWADVMAGVTFLVAFAAMIYTAFHYWGGFHNLVWKAYTSDIGPHIFSRTVPLQYFLTMLIFYGTSWMFIPHLVTRWFSAKDYKAVLTSGLGSNAGFAIGAFISPLILGFSLAAYYGLNLPNVEVVEGYVPSFFMDVFGKGFLTALILLGLIAITRSTIDSMLLVASSIVDVDILQKGLHIHVSSEKFRKLLSTLIIIFVAIASIAIALNPETAMVRIAYELVWPAYAIISWPTIIMLFWKRANKYGGIASYLAGFISVLLFTFVIWPESPHNPFGIWEGALPSLISIITLIVVSLLTPAPPKEFVEEFYG